jgi:hypothetical protein
VNAVNENGWLGRCCARVQESSHHEVLTCNRALFDPCMQFNLMISVLVLAATTPACATGAA